MSQRLISVTSRRPDAGRRLLPEARRILMDRERLKRIRNFQSDDWYPALIVRPITILVMLVIADWKFLTPNRLTTVANLCKLAGAALLVPEWTDHVVWGVVLLQLGVLFDHLDGTMARYSRTFTVFGSFYDKTSDLITWFVIMTAVGWRGMHEAGDPLMLVLTQGSAACVAVRGYMKWLITSEHYKRQDAQTSAPRISAPPERSARDWLRWFAKMSWQFYRFEEMDLFFWVGLGLLLDEVELLCWLLLLSQIGGLISMTIIRHLEAHKLDLAAHPRS
jgi:hypothetical protein